MFQQMTTQQSPTPRRSSNPNQNFGSFQDNIRERISLNRAEKRRRSQNMTPVGLQCETFFAFSGYLGVLYRHFYLTFQLPLSQGPSDDSQPAPNRPVFLTEK